MSSSSELFKNKEIHEIDNSRDVDALWPFSKDKLNETGKYDKSHLVSSPSLGTATTSVATIINEKKLSGDCSGNGNDCGSNGTKDHAAPVSLSSSSRPHTTMSTLSPSSPWKQDLAGLQEETSNLLKRYGVVKSPPPSASSSSPPARQLLSRNGRRVFVTKQQQRRRKRQNIRPKTHASTIRGGSGVLKGRQQQRPKTAVVATPTTSMAVTTNHGNKSRIFWGRNTEIRGNSNDICGRENNEDDLVVVEQMANDLHNTGKNEKNDCTGGWILVKDEYQNEEWYHNTKTGESRWDQPTSAPSLISSSSSPCPDDCNSDNDCEKYQQGVGGAGDFKGGKVLSPLDENSSLPPLDLGQQQQPETLSFLSSSYMGDQTHLPKEQENTYPATVTTLDGGANNSESTPFPFLHSPSASFLSNSNDNCNTQEETNHNINDSEQQELQERMFKADGTANSNLRDAISNALRSSKFDSVSTLLASSAAGNFSGISSSSLDGDKGDNTNTTKKRNSSSSRKIYQRQRRPSTTISSVRNIEPSNNQKNNHSFLQDEDERMVSIVKLRGRRAKTAAGYSRHRRARMDELQRQHPLHDSFKSRGSLSIRDVQYTGFEGEEIRLKKNQEMIDLNKSNETCLDTPEINRHKKNSKEKNNGLVCFNCWSAGKGKKCLIHTNSSGSASSKMMESEGVNGGGALMCKNWDIGVLRRRYRSEEIQEVFMKEAATLKFQRSSQQFCTVVEQKHPIYRLIAQHIAQCNFTSQRKNHVKLWFRSFIDRLKLNKIPGERSKISAQILRLKGTILNLLKVQKLSKEVSHKHPQAPITGTSLAERRGSVKILVEKEVMISQEISETQKFILVGPDSVPDLLYQPRRYEVLPPNCIPIPDPEHSIDTLSSSLTSNSADAAVAWIERLASSFAETALSQAQVIIKSVSPAVPDCAEIIQSPMMPPKTIKFATFGRKPTPNNLAVGGFSAELIISQLVVTYIPPQYGDMICVDKTLIIPKISPEVTTYFPSVKVKPKNQIFVDRELHHPLNSRRAPTIMVVTGYDKENKFFFGRNRCHQTGEEEHFGFRTSELIDCPHINDNIDTTSFLPAHEVASLNLPSEHSPIMTRADSNYPFRETNSRQNNTMEFYHLLLSYGVCSSNKVQVFTCIGTQKPGNFMRECDINGSLGQFASTVTRSWAFVQKRPLEKFFTDEGVPYWYDRCTGETFWEQPLIEEEKVPLKEGGVILGGKNNQHYDNSREKSIAEKERTNARKMILQKHETEEMKSSRLKAISRNMDAPEKTQHREEEGTEQPLVPERKDRRKRRRRQRKNSTLEEEDVSRSDDVSLETPSESKDASQIRTSEILITKADQSYNDSIVESITQALGSALKNVSNTDDMLKLGMGLGISLGAQGLLKGHQSQAKTTPSIDPTTPKERIADHAHNAPESGSEKHSTLPDLPNYGPNKNLDCLERHGGNESSHTSDINNQVSNKLEENKVHASNDLLNSSINRDNTNTSDLPQLITKKEAEKGPLKKQYETHRGAGLGNTFIPLAEEGTQNKVVGQGGIELQKLCDKIPIGFLNAISSKRVGKQYVEYLPFVPNLPQSKPIGRVKPRAAADDWMAIGFDPWSAGKEPLSAEFIPSLITQAGSPKKKLEENTAHDAFINLADETGLEAYEDQVSKERMMEQTFDELCSLIRHNKYRELEDMMNQPDWSLPIEYADESGNNLLMISCQNGNKRIAKLCLRRGSEINKQNINGQTCLHYAFGYGFDDLGNYLISKGADDSIANADGLTCYEGLNAEDVYAI